MNCTPKPLLDIPFVTVVSPAHPLAALRGIIPKTALEKHVQLVLTDRTSLTEGRDFSVLSPLTWRLADLGAKLAFLRAGLGWGHMPLHMVSADLDSHSLVKIRVEDLPRITMMPMKAVFSKRLSSGTRGTRVHRSTQDPVAAPCAQASVCLHMLTNALRHLRPAD